MLRFYIPTFTDHLTTVVELTRLSILMSVHLLFLFCNDGAVSVSLLSFQVKH